MLIFIIPLKSKEVSKSWIRTCQLLERSLYSICNQADPRFKVIVVCNTKPDIQFNHPSIEYLEVNFDIIPKSLLEKEIDKGKKVIKGLLYARNFSPTHIMVADADDCISCNLVKYVNENPDPSGWFLDSGYVYQEDSHFIYYRKSHFYSWCGTCNIIKFDICPLPEQDVDYPEDMVLYYSGKNHSNIKSQMKDQGYSLKALPFVGAIYIIGNGENIYQKGFSTVHNANKGKTLFFLKELFKFRLLTSSIRKEFGLYRTHSESIT